MKKIKEIEFLVLSRPDNKGKKVKITRELIEDEQINILLSKYDQVIWSGEEEEDEEDD